jgi:Tfp pilus assembly protein PilN
MRAVNLIPAGDRRGAGGAAGRSNGGVYVLLGALALIVIMAAAYTLSGKSVTDKKAELARVSAETTAAQAKATGLGDFTKFAALRTKRVDTVKQLANSRFDWSHALHEVARVIPTNAWLTSLTATTSPGVGVGGGSSGSLRAALAVPALEIGGCTTSQSSVARLMARLRLIDGVQQVSLQDSTKNATSSTGGGEPTGGGSGDCTGGSSHFPKFNVVVFYNQPAATPAATGGTTTAAAVTASGTTPASTTAPGATATASSTAASGGATP